MYRIADRGVMSRSPEGRREWLANNGCRLTLKRVRPDSLALRDARRRAYEMRVTVCELPNDAAALEAEWERLCAHVRGQESDLVLLPEMPFSPWLSADPDPDPSRWEAAVELHLEWTRRLPSSERERSSRHDPP